MSSGLHARLTAEQEKFGKHLTKEELDTQLEEAAERKAAIDQHKSDLSGQEVTFAKAIAAEIKQREVDGVAAQDGLTREDIEQDLRLAAERKQAIDDDKARNAGADYKHVREVVEQKKRSVEALQSEKDQLDAHLKEMEAKQRELEAKMKGQNSAQA